MRITELLDIRSIALDAAPKSKQETLDAAVALMVKSGKITDEDAYRAQVYAREEESTTGIGEGIAIPHGKCDAVNKPGLAAMVIPNGVDFDSLDGEPVTLLFLIAAPNTKDNVHLDVLSKLSMMLMDEEFTKSLRNARTPEEFLAIIDRADEEKKSVDERLAEPVEAKENQVKILAVTSCDRYCPHLHGSRGNRESSESKRMLRKSRDTRLRRSEKRADCTGNRRCGLHHRCSRRTGSDGSFRRKESHSAPGIRRYQQSR